MEIRAAFNRILHSDYFRAEVLTKLLDYIIIVSLFTINLIEGKKYGLFEFSCGAENVLCSYLHAIFRVNHNHSCVAHAKSCI